MFLAFTASEDSSQEIITLTIFYTDVQSEHSKRLLISTVLSMIRGFGGYYKGTLKNGDSPEHHSRH